VLSKEVTTSNKGKTFNFELKNGKTLIFESTKEDKILRLKRVLTDVERNVEYKAYVTTVVENETKYDKRQVESAKIARKFQEDMGISTTSLYQMLEAATIVDCPFTTKDLDRAELIYGPCASSLRGRMVDTVVKEFKDTPVPNWVARDTDMSSL
jgi:hypothetical protein